MADEFGFQTRYVLDFDLYVCRDLVKDSLRAEFLKNKTSEKKKKNMQSFLSITGTSSLIYK